jgi:hypothetical protein
MRKTLLCVCVLWVCFSQYNHVNVGFVLLRGIYKFDHLGMVEDIHNYHSVKSHLRR